MNRKKVKNLSLFVLATIALASGYYMNLWRVVDQNEFNNYDIYCQSQVIGRVIEADRNRIFSEAGLNGWVRDDSVMKNMTWDEMTYFQFEIYKNNLKLGPSNFIIYDSQLGGQGLIFALLDKISPMSKKDNLNMFWHIASISLALIMSFFIYWVFIEHGFYPSIITFLLVLFSVWLTFFGRNLYIVLSTSYLLFIVLLFLLYNESAKKAILSPVKLFWISSILVFIKLFFSGFEFITASLVMFTIPLFYYLFLYRWTIKTFIKRLTSIVLGTISAIILYSVLFSYQLSTLKGSFFYGFKYMLYTFLKRTHGNSADFPEGFKESLESNITEVLRMYLDSHAVAFGRIEIHFKTIILLFIIISLINIFSKKLSPSTYENRCKNNALMYTAWISITAPLSWFIVFKAHSFVHLGFDDIVWYMPFALFGFALTGSVLPTLLKDINTYFETNN